MHQCVYVGRKKQIFVQQITCHLGAFMCHLILLFITTVISSLFLCCFPDEKMGEQKGEGTCSML